MRFGTAAGLAIAMLAGAHGKLVAQQGRLPKPGLVIGQTDFARLRWIEGSWRGQSTDGAPFFERYRFVDDSTLLVESFADAKFGKPVDQNRYEWRDRRLSNIGTGPRWVATTFDSGSVGFKPVSGTKNAVMWQRMDGDHWSAVLSWPPTLDKPAREVVYHMERIKP